MQSIRNRCVLAKLTVKDIDKILKSTYRSNLVKLPVYPDLPSDAVIAGVFIDPRTDSVYIKYIHESFPEIQEGSEPLVLQHTNDYISVRRSKNIIGEKKQIVYDELFKKD